MLYYIRGVTNDSSKAAHWRYNLIGYTFHSNPIHLYAYCIETDNIPDLYIKGKYYYWKDTARKRGTLFE